MWVVIKIHLKLIKQLQNCKMLQRSYISDKKISKSLKKLNNVSPDKKLRVKSLRIKTQQNQSQKLLKLTSLEKGMQKSIIKRSQQSNILVQSQILKKLSLLPSLSSPFISSPIKTLLYKKQIVSNESSILQNVSTQLFLPRMRIKSSLLEKNYLVELIQKYKFNQEFLMSLFLVKLSQDQIQPNQDKFNQFLKNFYFKIHDKVQLQIDHFNFRKKAIKAFFTYFLDHWKGQPKQQIISLDLTSCCSLTIDIKNKQQQQEILIKDLKAKVKNISPSPNNLQDLWPKPQFLKRLISQEPNLSKLILRNMHFNPQQMVDIFACVLKNKHLYSLDISNKSSQTINRLGSDCYYLETFFAKNSSLGIIKMDNLNITDDCLQKMSIGILKNTLQPLRILSLAGNCLTHKSLIPLQQLIMKSLLTQLDLSNNPLGAQFYLALPNLRASQIVWLDLSSTQMTSQSLIHFLNQMKQNKCLQELNLSNNDFSHHWFNNITQLFQTTSNLTSLKYIDMNNCGIRTFQALFAGLTYNKNVQKLILSNNVVYFQQEDINKVRDCFKQNKALNQVKMKFCGYNQSMLMQIIQALKSNTTLQILDISQNHMSDNGGKAILKLLNHNSHIHSINIQKLQFTVRMGEQIQHSLQHNRSLRQNQIKQQLINQNILIKQKDTLSWKQIQLIQSQVKNLQSQISISNQKNTKIQSLLQKKKLSYLQLKKQTRQQNQRLDRQRRKIQYIIQTKRKKYQQELYNVQKRRLNIQQAIQIEQNLINTLQKKIQKENQIIKKRQNQLQQQLRQEKYMQKRKDKQIKSSGRSSLIQIDKKQVIKDKTFDNTKALVAQTKRKSVAASLTKTKDNKKN